MIVFIMGVSGSGKTTIGTLLARQLNLPFFDADDYHPASNKEKMARGEALSDDDRHDWLIQLHALAMTAEKKEGAVIACSALKEMYREILANGLSTVRWVYLEGSFALISERLKERKGHFMSPSLLQSQFDILQKPVDAIDVSIGQPPADIVRYLADKLSSG